VASAIDEAPVTGESLPVDKGAGDAVYAGTLNQTAAGAARDRRRARHAAGAHHPRRGAGAGQPRAHAAFVDRFAAIYTPVVFVLALAVAAAGAVAGGWAWHAPYKALVLLVIACPCALVIATPVTVVSALARGGAAC
jgi:Cd2+/Zn2+-exporting ATPase